MASEHTKELQKQQQQRTKPLLILLPKRNKVYMVLRAVAKAFENLWHNCLKYQILISQIPSISEKKMFNFWTIEKEKINIGKEFTKWGSARKRPLLYSIQVIFILCALTMSLTL